jgi:TonB-linked SusC/RagA family outer membrane protein
LRLTAALALALAPAALAAQDRTTISGTVRASSGEPIGSAQVQVVGTGPRVLTTPQGTYRLVVPGERGSRVRLRASKLGSSSQEVQVVLGSDAVTQNFSLAEQSISLEAVVATGSPAGTATRREVANSVAQVATAEIVDRVPSIPNVTAVLQSRIPGVQVMTQAGTEGTSQRIRIRGVSSVSAGSAPIYVIDGVRMNGGSQGGFDLSGAVQSASDAVHPQDIESIEVIKGPAAATLYGADAANGVISITTKKGRPGQPRVRVTARSSYGEQEWGGKTLTNYTLCTPARIAASGSGAIGSFPGCSGLEANTLISANLLRDDPNALRTGHTRTQHLSATGGGERFGFFVSGNYDNNDGVVYNNNFRRLSGRTNFTFSATDALNAQVNLGYYRTDVRLPFSDNSSNGLTRNANRAVPGRLGTFGIGWLGLSPTEINAFDDQTRTDRYLFSTTVRYQPFSWFQNRLSGGFDYNNRKNERFYRIDTTGKVPYGAVNATGAVLQFKPLNRLYTVDYAGTVTAGLPRGVDSETSFGAQVIAARAESLQGNADGLSSNNVKLLSLASNTQAFEGLSEQSTVGFFAQQKFSWRDRLFITAGLRTDDNSAFGEEFEFVVYPKLGASYVISEEAFFNVPGVDQLRLRGAWGRAGNSPAPYSAERTFAVTQYVLADATARGGLVPTAFGNSALHAEQGEEFEVGFDGSLFNGRIALDFTYFNKVTKDALVPFPAPPSSGFTGNRFENAGKISNRGTEATLSVIPVERRNFNWESRIAHSTLRNRLENFGGVRDEPIFQCFTTANLGCVIRPNSPLPQFFGTVPSRDDAGNYLRTASGNLIVDRDTIFFGGSLPTRTLSWENNFRVFRNLRFGAQLDHQGGHYQLNLTRRTRANDGVLREAILTPASTAQDTLNRTILLSGAGAQFIEKADFVKLREVSASYTLPSRFTRRAGSDEVILTVSGRNLRTWSDYTGSDPEVNADNSDFLLAETNAIPPTRRVTASLTVRF